MIAAGLDIGSRTVKFAVMENGNIIFRKLSVSSFNPMDTASELMRGINYDVLVATGYGRHLAKSRLDCEVISEIKAFGLGARFFSRDCRSILDIGGQDTKAIFLDERGNMRKFEMNDKCAAGTGRFLEIMSAALGYSLKEFSEAALSAEKSETINSTCTVFAESEVISLINQGSERCNVALGIHKSIISKSITFLKRTAPSGDIFFAGGVALNKCCCELLEQETGRKVILSSDPQIIGAVGAAICAAGLTNKLIGNI